MNIDGKKLKAFLDRMDEEADARDKHTAAIRDIVKAAKDADIDSTTLRKVHTRRRMDSEKRQRADDLIDIYEHSLGMAVSMVTNGEVSLRQAAALTGVSKSSIHRALAVPELSPDWVDFEYTPISEMHADDLGSFDIGNPDAAREMTEADLGDPLLVIDKPRAQFREKIRAAAASISCPKAPDASDTVSARAPDTWDDIVRDHPPFLRRTA